MDDYCLTPQERKAFMSFVCNATGCQDLDDHQHFVSRDAFDWCLPRFHVNRPADTTPRVLLNRYPHNVIGAAVVLFGRCWGVNWKS